MIKKTLITLTIAIAISALGYFGLLFNTNQINNLATYEIERIISLIETTEKESGVFPENPEELIKNKSLRQNIKFGIFSTKINIYEHESNYFVEYYQPPFGPFYGYNFKTKEWYSTE